MGHALYIERELIPFAEEGKEIMLIFRDHGLANALPQVYVTALEPNTEVQFRSGSGGDTDAFTSTSTVTLPNRGQKDLEAIPIGGDLTDRVTAIRIISGAAAVTIVSPSRVKAEFRTRKHP